MIPFSMNAIACLPDVDIGEQWSIPAEEEIVRKDLRNIHDLHIYSVDPPGCQDIDDTMHARGKFYHNCRFFEKSVILRVKLKQYVLHMY